MHVAGLGHNGALETRAQFVHAVSGSIPLPAFGRQTSARQFRPGGVSQRDNEQKGNPRAEGTGVEHIPRRWRPGEGI